MKVHSLYCFPRGSEGITLAFVITLASYARDLFESKDCVRCFACPLALLVASRTARPRALW